MYNEDISAKNENFERYKERLTNFSNDFELGLFIHLAQKSILWVILFFSLGSVGAFIYLRYTQPVYQSSATLQIKNENSANRIINIENPYETNNISAEIEILRSKEFLKSIIRGISSRMLIESLMKIKSPTLV